MKKIIPIVAVVTLFTGCHAVKTEKASAASLTAEIMDIASDDESFAEMTSMHYAEISIAEFSDGFNHARYEYPDSIPPWKLYDTDQIRGLAENMIYLQNPDGGWAKNLDLQRVYSLSELKELKEKNKDVEAVTYGLKKNSSGSTMDNGNIYSQMKYLCQVYAQTGENRYLTAATKALNWILNAQHPSSGGFTGSDVYGITYNDNVMSNALGTLKSVADDYVYDVFPNEMREKAREAYYKGIDCILKTQITVTLEDGSKLLTAWCQQHDHDTLKPIWAREYEPPSICSSESFKILRLLMADENPTEEMKKAIVAGAEFFDRDDVRIHGKKRVSIPLSEPVTLNNHYYDHERVLEDVPDAPDMWARFYALDSSFDVKTGSRKPVQGTYPAVLSPVWVDRGCIFVNDFSEISMERRNGYAYTNTSGDKFLKEYKEWKAKYIKS